MRVRKKLPRSTCRDLSAIMGKTHKKLHIKRNNIAVLSSIILLITSPHNVIILEIFILPCKALKSDMGTTA
jgi:hypothetical protein